MIFVIHFCNLFISAILIAYYNTKNYFYHSYVRVSVIGKGICITTRYPITDPCLFLNAIISQILNSKIIYNHN